MSHYRELNKELVEQVQIMRENTKLYCDEIINLKAELAQKYESEVLLRKQCYNWAVDNFLQLIETVQPYSDILPILKEHTQPQKRLSSGYGYSDTLRHSSRLTIELQRSNSVINTRKSLCSTSPIRRSSKSASNYENEKEQEVDQEQGEKNQQDNEQELTKQTTQEPLQNADSENIIYEESEDDGEEDEIFEVCNESTNESVEEVTVDISYKSRTLKDVTNTSKDFLKADNSLSKVVRKKGRPKKIKETNLSDSENITDYTTSMDLDCDTDMEGSASIRRIKNRTNNSVINVSQETLEEPRIHTRYSNLTYISLPIDQNQTRDDVTLSHTSVNTDMTLKHFKNAACSTPNSRDNSLRKSKAQPTASLEPALETTPISANTEFSSTRPSRQCKPKILAEAKLNNKLRNDSETRKKTRHKAKAKKQ